MLQDRYDVVIVGGRPAGATLAARLGAAGRSVLVVDRAEFPSLPAVPSCPVLYPQAMTLLDEIGLPESAYAQTGVPVHHLMIEFGSWFDAPFRMIESRGRDYVLSIDRATFDNVLWDHLAKYPSVTRQAGFGVTDLLWDGDRVVGVQGHDGQRIHAKIVVGADGRFSLVGRKAGAVITEDGGDQTSTVYWCDWEGVAPFKGETHPIVQIHATGRGTDVLFFPLPGGRTTVCTHQRSDRVTTEGDAMAWYTDVIMSVPTVKRRLAPAKCVTELVGMKHVANRFMTASGKGWVLTGDAFHHKDPADGQGIYDAFLETKILAEHLLPALDGDGLDAAMVAYGEEATRATRPMFLATVDRLKGELYSEPPALVIKTVIRWLMTHEEYKTQFLRYLCREIDPDKWLTRGLMGRAVASGAWGDVVGMFRRS